MSVQPRLFPDDSERVRVTWSTDEGCWVSLCRDCSKKVASSRSKDVARSSGIEHIGRHSCGQTRAIPY